MPNRNGVRSFVLRSRNIVLPEGVHDGAVIVVAEKIVDVVRPQDIPSDYAVLDVGDLVVAPGLVDPHVHINEPGRTTWEGFETATRAAAAGGVTTLVDMPLNSSPVTTTVEGFRAKLDAAQNKLYVDVGFHGGLVPENADQLRPLLDTGVLGVKAFMIHSGIDEFPATTENGFRKAMPAIAERGLPLLVHAELASSSALSAAKSIPRSKGSKALRSAQGWAASRPRTWENDAVALMIRLCKEFRCRVHIVHVSSSEAIALLRGAKESGLPITAETCHHYLFFATEEIADGDTRFKCAPPIRERENNDKLWKALEEGVIDFVSSDHSPCPPEMKLLESGDFMKAWGGIASLQFGLSIIWTEARKRGFTIADVSRWMSLNAAKFLAPLAKGTIEAGCDADFVVWNPDESYIVEPAIIHHRHKVTPYEGRTLFGKVHATYLRGNKIYERGAFSQPTGRALRREEP
jgi:allantoinase